MKICGANLSPHQKNGNSKRNKSKLPYAFTEQGIAMLSALLKSNIAISVSVNIMKAFIEMRRFIAINGQVFERLSTLEYKQIENVILTSSKSNIQNLDVEKFNKEYPILKISKTNKFHDRFIIIDNKELYHCGASIKDLGKKCFAISKMEDISFIGKLATDI